jgi:hypothetical protein
MSLILSNILKIFQSMVFVTVFEKCLFSKKSTVLFGTWYDCNLRGSLYKKYMLTHSMGLINNLEKIDLNENEIQKLDPLTFDGLERLEFIDLSWNHIKELHVDTFDGLKNLYVGRRRECN